MLDLVLSYIYKRQKIHIFDWWIIHVYEDIRIIVYIYYTHRSRINKYRKGRLIGIDNGQLTFNEKSGLINRGRGSYNIQTRLYTAVHTQLHNIYYYDVVQGGSF